MLTAVFIVLLDPQSSTYLPLPLPAVYSTLSKLWVAKLSSSEVVTTDVYTYIGIIVEVMNDGIPRSAWLIIGDKSSRSLHSRLNLAWTTIIVCAAQGLLMTVIFLATSTKLVAAFVPAEVRHASYLLVRTVVVGARFSVTSIPVPLRVVVAARDSRAPVNGSVIPFGTQSQ
ncbi:hypothetical protein N7501_002915 [Penicillium viridicatum]|nr:hypothetical protein N7501_002915 [Penicillium viridicatum]